MQNCIITGDLIDANNNSRAHVFPSALGGRLKPKDILSRVGNGILEDKVDFLLIEAFQAIMSLLNGSRDRGQNQPILMTDQSGRSYRVAYDKPLSPEKPVFSENATEAGIEFQIRAGTFKQVRELLGRVKKKYHLFDVDEALGHAFVTRTWPIGMLRTDLQIGPRAVFPALFASASIFAALHGSQPHPELKNYIKSFDPDKPIMPPDTFYFMPPKDWISASVDVSHIVAMVTSVARRQAFIYLEVFNVACVGVLLPYEGAEDVIHTYGVDVLAGCETQVLVDADFIKGFPWSETHKIGESEFFNNVERRLTALLQIIQIRSFEAFKRRITTQFLGGNDDKAPTRRLDAMEDLVEFALNSWRNPLFDVAKKNGMFEAFSDICQKVILTVPIADRTIFMARYRAHSKRMKQAIEDLL